MSRPCALSPLESGFLQVESPRTPMHMGTLGIFEGPPLHDTRGHLRLEDVRNRIEGRLDLVPKLRRRIQGPVLPGAPPVWIDDPHFDIAHHVEVRRLSRPGSNEQLWEECNQLMGQPLDRAWPLWHFCVIDGLADQRVAVVARIHHALADGLAGVEIGTLLFDIDTEPVSAPAANRETSQAWHPEAPPALAIRAVQDLDRLSAIGCRWMERGGRAGRHPLRTGRGAARLGGAFAALARSGLLRPATSLNRAIGSERLGLGVRVPLNSLHTTAHALGVTLNEIVLTAVGGGIARLLEQRGEARPPDIQVLVPVGLEPDHRESLDNRVSVWFVRVPLEPADPLDRLHSVSRSSSRARVHHEELAAEAALDLTSAAPQQVIKCVAQLINHQPLFNLVVTNVPGPSDPLYLLRAAMVEVYPFVPLAGNLTIGVAAMSYDDYLSFGILADLITCPDAANFARGLQDDLESLAPQTHR